MLFHCYNFNLGWENTDVCTCMYIAVTGLALILTMFSLCVYDRDELVKQCELVRKKVHEGALLQPHEELR